MSEGDIDKNGKADEAPKTAAVRGIAVKKRIQIRKKEEYKEEEVDLSRYGTRRQARIYAMQALFWYDANEDKPTIVELTSFDFETGAIRPKIKEFAAGIIKGVLENLAVIDEVIVKHSTNWRIERISFVDRAILRLSVYSLFYQPEVPRSVIIDEAIEIAKVFGGKDAYKFVNGILDGIDREKRE
ncbi:MAG: transcription antitermination factor NusB [Spirochaetes bacterium]|nr:transcription antitermination factor NusB [Spirochaetota bacterium]